MALKRGSKISSAFNMSSMTDVVFLLLIFFMLTSTLVHPNALKLVLPQSKNQASAKPQTSVSITADLRYYVETKRVSYDELEPALAAKLGEQPDMYIALHVDETVPMREVVKVMNTAKKHKYKLIPATRAK